MYRHFPTPTPRLLDGEPRIVEPTLVKEFVPAVGPIAPRQHRDRINGESKVILASLQGILRRQRRPKRSDFPGRVCRLFQLGSHGTALIGFVHITNKNYVPHTLRFHKRNAPSRLVSIPAFTRSARGIELTPAGRAFLDQAPLVLSETAVAQR